MQYITVEQAAARWGLTRRRVQLLCAEGRVKRAVKRGNVWLIPRSAEKPEDLRPKAKATVQPNVLNRIVCADCLGYLPLVPSQSVDLILCDLPYGTSGNDWDVPIDLDALWAQYLRVIKPDGVIALTAAGRFTARLLMSQPALYRYRFVWVKPNATNHFHARNQPMRQSEDVLIFCRSHPKYNAQLTEEGQYPSDVLRFPNEPKAFHPTQKPVEMGRLLVRTYTSPGDTVMDNCAGSGSFLIAALMEGRNFVGIEQDEGYAEVAKQRLRDAWHGLGEEKTAAIQRIGLITEFEREGR